MSATTAEDHYPVDCPFCGIAQTYPSPISQISNSDDLKSCVPDVVDAEKVSPSCHLVLSAPEVLAFLDIMPMTMGHLLVTTRSHRLKIEHVPGNEASDIGFWLPILAKAVSQTVGVTDYNIVQNNGPRAAQVVPHVHFHIIPRPESVPTIQNKSWTMFGRGKRDDLDDDEAANLAAEIRRQIRKELDHRSRNQSNL
ncbi:HIT-like protein [Microthyrium microscopicum]|uniref:HIT-like protein n=1 Tax=Microthyrium microscopicum TaxID=703497 RepID=A0A6A6U905_9PEZI|nr:HIT-like protein [Microthyrium microscopicum]